MDSIENRRPVIAGWFLLGLVFLLLPSVAAAETARWLKLRDHVEFSPRDTAEGFKFKDYLWISNGYQDRTTDFFDLWRSRDGLKWERVSDATPYDPYAHIAVFGGKLWAVDKTAWVSADGVAWEEVARELPFADDRYDGDLVTFRDRLWFVGPTGVWWSRDGRTWSRATRQAPFGPRFGFSVAVFRGRLWVLAGHVTRPRVPPETTYPAYTTLNDVWSSRDGRSWRRERRSAPFSSRMWARAITHNGLLYLIAGLDNVRGRNLNDTWASRDGRRWTKLKTNQSFSARHLPTLFSVNGRLLLLAGNGWPVQNDVWELRFER